MDKKKKNEKDPFEIAETFLNILRPRKAESKQPRPFDCSKETDDYFRTLEEDAEERGEL